MSQPPAVVAYMSYLGLGLARALGRTGVPVYALDPNPRALGMNSRYVTPVVTPDLKQDEATYLEFLLEFGRSLPARAVLYATGDPTVLLFSRERERLAECYDFVMPEHETVVKLLTKDGLAAAAEETGAPAPRTLVPADRAALEAQMGGLQFPVLLKPMESHAWKAKPMVAMLGVGTKVIPCADAAELLAQYERVAAHDPSVIVQEIVPGGDERLVYVCVCVGRGGEWLGAFAGRKPRVLPPGLGSASYAFTFHDPGLLETARRLCQGVGYRGLGGIEFKLDPRDNTYKLIEWNVRFGLWDALGARCGVNLARLAWLDAQGLAVEPAFDYRAGASWCSFQRDLSAFKLYRRQGTLGVGAWLRSLLGVDMWAVFAWDDPKPWLTETPGYLWDRIAPRIGLRKDK